MKDTPFYGRLTAQEARMGKALAAHTYVSRQRQSTPKLGQPARSVNGERQVQGFTLWVPKGTVVYEGKASGWPGGPPAGSQQTVVRRLKQEWLLPD